jgi:hypothetical protein
MTFFIIKHLHWGYWLLYSAYLFIIINKMTRVWAIYSAGCDYKTSRARTPEWKMFDNLIFQAREAYREGNKDAADNRIDELWIQFRATISSLSDSVSGYINAVILWGFAGTLFGSFVALFQMGEALVQPSVSARIAGTAGILRDSLSLAMLTSLLSSIIGAIAITFMCSGIQSKWINGIASILNNQVYDILKQKDHMESQKY